MNFIFPSTLIITNSENQILDYIQSILKELNHTLDNNPDIFFLREYTINQVREIKNFLSKKPFNHDSKIVIITNANNLNNESQNALLKTLEEPGEGNYILLSTTNSSTLLPTILSRCQIIKIKNQKIDTKTPLLKISDKLSENLLTAEELSKDKTSILPYLENQIELYHQELINNPNLDNSYTIIKLQKCIDMIKANVDPKSALDYFFLT